MMRISIISLILSGLSFELHAGTLPINLEIISSNETLGNFHGRIQIKSANIQNGSYDKVIPLEGINWKNTYSKILDIPTVPKAKKVINKFSLRFEVYQKGSDCIAISSFEGLEGDNLKTISIRFDNNFVSGGKIELMANMSEEKIFSTQILCGRYFLTTTLLKNYLVSCVKSN